MTYRIIKFGIIAVGIDLNLVNVFITVVEKGSFIRAARALNMPASNVSRRVAQLEQQLGLRVLERNTRTMRLTESGQILYDDVKPHLQAIENVQTLLASKQVGLDGSLSVSMPASDLIAGLLGPVLADFSVKNPRLAISCTTTLSGTDSLMEDADLAFIFDRGRLADSAFIVTPVATFPSVIVAAPVLLDKIGVPTHVEALKRLPCITSFSVLRGMPWVFNDDKGNDIRIDVNSRYRVNGGELARTAALSGVGLAILARRVCVDDLAQGRLVEVALNYSPAPLRLYAAYASRRHALIKSKELIKRVKARLENEQ